MIENELTFLVKELPKNIEKYPKKIIKQGYFSDFPSPLRIRSEDAEIFTLTKKEKIKEGDCSRHNETTIKIKEEEFEILWPLCKKSLEKERFYYPVGDLTAEVDIFSGDLQGFNMVEVEFPDEKTRESFTPPDWFGTDITQKKWAANSVLSEMTYQEVLLLIKKEGLY